ncbi:hypothetical protein [uncultured Psychroserpens sp.]|uniref:hypothetical protein n=1 Tax=uncultured Psychroserpens sp. TaxID=255436 RepID=UPI002613A582|nr:hypothetical protein [uncultured Psychroserpens sp.]
MKFVLNIKQVLALKDKVFKVLTEQISVTEFEEWLYNSEELLSQIESNTFAFDAISINYKSNEWNSKLNTLLKEYQCDELLEIITIRKACVAILISETFEDTYELLKISTRNFDYDTEYTILCEFYSFRNYFGLVEEGFWKIGVLEVELKLYAKQIVELINEYQNFERVKEALKLDLKPYKIEKNNAAELDKTHLKTTLKQKLFAFFKKS